MPPAAIIGGVVVAGAIAGSQKKKSHSSETSGYNLADANQAEKGGFELRDSSRSSLEDILNSGPNSMDYQNGIDSQRDLASLLGDYSKSGGLPNQNDINSANDVTKNLFASRQTGLNQSFIDQNTEAERLAARLGRPVNDPILQAKLRTGFIRQQDLLDADQVGASSNLALQIPGQRLNYASQQTNLLSQLGQQAVSNRNYLLGLGSQIGESERNFRLQTAERYGKSTSSSGGGLGGAISGGIAGLGAGMSMGGSLMAPGGFLGSSLSSSGMPAPTQNYTTMPSSNGFNLGNPTQFSNFNLFGGR